MKQGKNALRQMAKGSRRKAHFAAGGTPAMWRGRASRDLDASSSKARKNKLACRAKATWNVLLETP